MPRRRSRIRRFAKWTALLFCAAIIIADIASGWRAFWVAYIPDKAYFVALSHGRLRVGRVAWSSKMRPHFRAWSSEQVEWGYQWKPLRLGSSTVFIPLWMPLLVCAGLTGFLWWRDRPSPPGYSDHCGYDLTGNISGVCPECGSPIAVV